MDVFDLAAKITLDKSDYEKGLDDASTKTSGFASKLGTVVSGAAKVSAAAIGAVTAGTVAVGKTFYNQAKEIAEYGDNIDKMSQKIGISAEAYQEWDAILQHSGASVDSLQPSMKTLATQAQTGNEAFEKLGIAQEDVAKLSTEDLFSKVVAGLQNMEEGTERTYIASQLLGRGATELAGLFNTSAEDTEKMRQAVHDLGGVMSNEAVKSAATYQDTLQDMTTAVDGIKRGLFSGFMPAITEVMSGITMIFSKDGEGGIAKISEGLSSFISQMSDTAVQISEKGGQIVLSLVSAISDNLPELVKAGADVVVMLARGVIEKLPDLVPTVIELIQYLVQVFIENAPDLIKAAFELVATLALGLAEALPTLIPSVVDLIMTIVKELTSPESLLNIVNAALQLIMGLAEGIIDAIPVLIDSLPEIIENIIDFLIGAIPMIIQAGIQLLTSIVGALPTIIQSIVKALPKIITKIIDGLTELIPLLVTAGVDLFVAIVKDLPTIIKEIVKAIPDIIEGIVSGFGGLFDKMVSIGENVVKGLWEGIKGLGSWIWDNVSGWAGDLFNGVKDFFGIHSPSKKFEYIGENMSKGLGKGFVDEMKTVESDMLSAVPTNFDTNSSFQTVAGQGYARQGSRENLTIILEVDKQRFAKAVVDLSRAENRRRGELLFNI